MATKPNPKPVNITDRYEVGKEVLAHWQAPDYHPYERGIGWYISFGILTIGTAVVTYLMDPTSSAVPIATMCLISAFYLWVHRDGAETHDVVIYENGIKIGNARLMPWRVVKGYWFIQDAHSKLLVLDTNMWHQDRIRILMGDLTIDEVNWAMEQTDVPHLPDKKEATFDLWSRVFRL